MDNGRWKNDIKKPNKHRQFFSCFVLVFFFRYSIAAIVIVNGNQMKAKYEASKAFFILRPSPLACWSRIMIKNTIVRRLASNESSQRDNITSSSGTFSSMKKSTRFEYIMDWNLWICEILESIFGTRIYLSTLIITNESFGSLNQKKWIEWVNDASTWWLFKCKLHGIRQSKERLINTSINDQSVTENRSETVFFLHFCVTCKSFIKDSNSFKFKCWLFAKYSRIYLSNQAIDNCFSFVFCHWISCFSLFVYFKVQKVKNGSN